MKILIVGLGSMGKRRARLIKQQGAYEIFGVDHSPERCKEAEQLGIKSFQSIPEACEAESFDCAFVCTAPLTHAIIINDLLDENLHVFTELNLVGDGYEGLIEKAKEKGLTLFLSSTMLYRAETQYVEKKVGSFGQEGKNVSYIYHIGQYLPDWHPWENYKDFFVGNKRTGGIREILAIDLPWLISAFGGVQSLHVQSSKISELEIDYDDSWFISLRHQNGAMGVLAVDVVSPKAVRNLEVYGEGLHLFWEGSPQSLYEYNCDTKEKNCVSTYESLQQDARYSDNIVENAYVDEILNFFDVMNGKAQPKWSFEQDLEIIALMEKIENYKNYEQTEEEKDALREEAIEDMIKSDDIAALESL